MVKANRSLTVNRDPRPYRRVTRICMACNLSSDTAQIFPTHALLPIALFADKWPATLFGIRGRFRAPFVVVNKKKKKRGPVEKAHPPTIRRGREIGIVAHKRPERGVSILA